MHQKALFRKHGSQDNSKCM